MAVLLLMAACGNQAPQVEGNYTYAHAFDYDLDGNHFDVSETGTMDFYADGKLAVGRVTQDLLRECGCTMDEADGIIQKMMSIDGVEAACLFKETEQSVRASLRGRSYANMAGAAANFAAAPT